MITVTRHFRSHVLPQQILLIAKKDSVLASHGNSRNNINFGIEEVSLLPYSQDSTCRKWILQWRCWWSTTTAALTTETQSSSFAWDVQNHAGVSRHADAGAPPASPSPRVHLRQHGPPGGEAGVRVVQHIHGDGDAWAPIVREGAKRTRGRWGRARSGRPARTKPRRLNRSSSPCPSMAQRSLHRPSPTAAPAPAAAPWGLQADARPGTGEGLALRSGKPANPSVRRWAALGLEKKLEARELNK